ncbi:MAG: hypothetical protein JO128_06995 [Alphaproteobacteria bacterium]|nr:hypothetical protein [Alphaproteobacteria bacterium]
MVDTIQGLIEQGNVAHGRRTHATADGLLPNFATELQLNAAALNAVRDRAREFIIEVILPISWYTRKIAEAQKARVGYIWGTGLLILIIPALIAFLPWRFGMTGSPTVVAQLTGGLTGVLALQKMIGATLTAQQRYGAWWKVSADLKKLWYGLQTKWNGTVTDAQRPAFLDDMAARIDQARQLVSDEEADFFQKLTIPSVDVLDLLTKSRPDVASMIGALLPGASSASAVTTALTGQVTDGIKAKQEIAKNQALLASLDAAIVQRRAELANPPAGQTAAQITDVLNALLKRRNDSAMALMEAQAALAAAEAH